MVWPSSRADAPHDERVICSPKFIGGTDCNSVAAGVEASAASLEDLILMLNCTVDKALAFRMLDSPF